MEFNSDQREVMPFGKLNQDRTYVVNGRVLGNVKELRDQDIKIHTVGLYKW